MNQKTEPRPTVVIDMAAEKDRPGRQTPGRAPLLLALAALLLTALGLGGGYYWWQQARADFQGMNARLQAAARVQQELQSSLEQAQQLLSAQQQKIAALNPGPLLEKGLDEARQSLEQQRQLMSAERTRMEKREVELRATIADLRKRLGNPDERWMVAEAGYLLEIARRRLELAKDTETALAALGEAEQRLADTGDPRWDALRGDITRHMAALKQLQSRGRSALLAKLDQLRPALAALQVRVLAHNPDQPSAPEQPATSTPGQAAHSMKGLGRDLLRGLKNAVRIRHHDQPVQNLVLSGQEALLHQNLYLVLETARLAVVQDDAQLYTDSLARLERVVRQYFRTETDSAQALLTRVQALQSAPLHPPLPDLTPLLDALHTRQQLADSPAEAP